METTYQYDPRNLLTGVSQSFNSTDTIQNSYDGNGNITQRVWVSALGQTNRTQTLTWDAFDRLMGVVDRDAVSNGFNWVAVYDGLGRRLRTVNTLVLSNTPVTSLNSSNAVSQVDSWYDPQVEYLEVGVTVNGWFTLKTYGPDANGVYGGMQGVGGLETVLEYGQLYSTSPVADFFGNVVASVKNGTVAWNPARFSSYGPVPGYQTPALSLDVPLEQALGWRGERVDETGLIYLNARYYDPVAGRFISHDPLFDPWSPDGFALCGGDAVNRFDTDGRAIIQAWEATQQRMLSSGGFWNNVGAYGISFAVTALNAFSFGSFARNDALVDRNLASEISDRQLYAGWAINSGSPLAATATGGAVAPLAARGLVAAGSPALMYVGSGVAAGASSAAVDVSIRRTGYAAAEMQYDGTFGGDLAYIGGAAALGGAFGGVAYAATRAGGGLIYLRTDTEGGFRDYYGRAESDARYQARQQEHSADYPEAQFDFEAVSGARPGRDLQFMEQFYITANGGARTQNPFTPLSNAIRAMSDQGFADYLFDASAPLGIAGLMGSSAATPALASSFPNVGVRYDQPILGKKP